MTPFVPLAALIAWTRWLRRRTATPPWARAIAISFVAIGSLGVVVTIVLAVQSFGAATADSTSEADAARMLAEGLSESMNCGALASLVAVAGAVWLVVCTWRWHWSAKPPVIERGPYR
jgi:hypothetical protein